MYIQKYLVVIDVQDIPEAVIVVRMNIL